MAMQRRVFAFGMTVQLLGAAATFATGLTIAWAMGPAAQGRYGLLRTAADLLLALALFGLPQSLVYAINRQGASPALLARATARYGAGLLLLWMVVAWSAALLPPSALPGWLDGPWALLALGLAVSGWLVQGLWRVLILVLADPLRFAWASVLPALTLLAAVMVALACNSQRFEWALAASGVTSLLLAGWQLHALRGHAAWRQGGPVPLPALAASGFLAMAQTVALALQPWLTLLLLQLMGAGEEETGWFVFASLVPQLFALPASFVAPLLLERQSRTGAAAASHLMRRWLPASGFIAAAAVAVALLLPWLVPIAFGAAYTGAVPACIWMAISGPFIVVGRLSVAVLMGQGAFGAAALHALARSLAVPVAVPLALAAMPSDRAAAAALAWLLVEALAVALSTWLVLRHSREAS